MLSFQPKQGYRSTMVGESIFGLELEHLSRIIDYMMTIKSPYAWASWPFTRSSDADDLYRSLKTRLLQASQIDDEIAHGEISWQKLIWL
jgi:hypothetical protein